MDLNKTIKKYFDMGLNYSEIIEFLHKNDNISMSLRTLKRILKSLSLARRKNFSSIATVADFLSSQVQGSSQLHGYKWMHLKCIQNGFTVKQETVRYLLNDLDPEGVAIRKRKRLRRRQYHNKGPNYLWHTDCYDKLKPYGIPISGCIDGFSRYILWLEAAPTCNDPRVIGGFFLNAVSTLKGCPTSLRTDAGTENRHIEQIQTFFHRNNHSNNRPFLYGTSPANQRIEAWWGHLRKHCSQFWMNTFQLLKDDGYFSGSFVDKNLIRFCFIDLIRSELNNIKEEWNSHKIRSTKNAIAPSGRPTSMFNLPHLWNSESYLFDVQDEDISVCKDECLFVSQLICDETIFQLCHILIEENNLVVTNAHDAYDAVNLYIELKILFDKLLENTI